MKRIFIGFLTFIAVLAASLGAFLFVSLIPFFKPIGFAAAGVVILGLVCVAALMISFTISRISHNRLTKRVIVAGEVVAYVDEGGGFTHLSAMHEAAKVIPQVSVSKQEQQEPLPSEAYVVLDMHRQGIGFKRIAEATLWSEYAVRKLCNQVDGKPS